MKLTLSNSLEKYSKIINIKPKKLSYEDNFYNIPFDGEYICICSGNKNGKAYKFWNDVIEIISSKTNKFKFIQIGNVGDKTISNAIPAFTTDPFHVSFIIKNASLVLTEDSGNSYFCYYHDIPSVVLSNENLKNNIHTKIIKEKTKNPEIIANYAFDHLGIGNVNYKTDYIGQYYDYSIYDIIPEFVPPLKYSSNSVFFIRNDLKFDLKFLSENLQNFKSHILTYERIPLDFLIKHKPQIKEIVYKVKVLDIDFINDLEKSGIPYIVVNFSKENINNLKYKLLDYSCFVFDYNKKLDFKIQKNKKYYLRTNRRILSKNNMYFNDYFYIKKIPCLDRKIEISQKDLTNKLFLQDCDYYWIFSE